jgi:hypothetical protein
MPAVSESIVREYFELQQFVVRQYRKYVAPAGRDDEDVDFLVLNPHPEPLTHPLPFVLTSRELRRVERAVVVLKAWHAEVFSPALLANSPKLFRFLGRRNFQAVVREFGNGGPVLKVLCIPCLPHNAQSREDSIVLLRSKGIDAVLSFRTMLTDLLSHVESTRNYQKSDLLQTFRILKNYDFLKEPQMELFKSTPGRRTRSRAKAKPADDRSVPTAE